MKTLKIALFLSFLLIASSLFAQQKKTSTQTVKVYGNCEMCQTKIEKAAKKAGAATAKWDVDTKVLSVTFPSGKSAMPKVEAAVAAVGYDTEHLTATDAAYDNLPGCCQYERKEAAKTNAPARAE